MRTPNVFSFQIMLFSMSNNCLFGVMYNCVLQCHFITGFVWPRIVWVSAAPCRGSCPLKLNWAPICPGFNSQRHPFAIPYSADVIPLSDSLVAIPSLHDRAPSYNCSALSFIGIDLIQNLPPDHRIKIIKFTAGFCLASSCDVGLHPAGNPTVRQLPGAIAITELSIQCHW